MKVDLQCSKLMEWPHPVNPAGFVIHGTLHAARSDAQCVPPVGIAVSAQNACRIQTAAQAGGGELVQVNPKMLDGVAHAMKVQTDGLGGAFVRPALRRKLDRDDPGGDA